MGVCSAGLYATRPYVNFFLDIILQCFEKISIEETRSRYTHNESLLQTNFSMNIHANITIKLLTFDP